MPCVLVVNRKILRILNLALGALSFWPIISMALFVAILFFASWALFFSLVFKIPIFWDIVGFAFICGIWLLPSFPLVIILGIVYIIHMQYNPRFGNNSKLFWIPALIFLCVWAVPAYWYRFIWRKPLDLLGVPQSRRLL